MAGLSAYPFFLILLPNVLFGRSQARLTDYLDWQISFASASEEPERLQERSNWLLIYHSLPRWRSQWKSCVGGPEWRAIWA